MNFPLIMEVRMSTCILGDSLYKNTLKTIARLFNEESIQFEVFQKISALKCIAAIKRSSLEQMFRKFKPATTDCAKFRQNH